MKKIYIDIVVIVVAAVGMILLDSFDLLEKSAKFMLIPILAFYYFGKYVGKRYG